MTSPNGYLIRLIGTDAIAAAARKPRCIDQIAEILGLDVLQGQMMAALKVHLEAHVTFTGLPQLLTPRLDVITASPSMHGRHQPQQLIVLGIDLIGHGDGRERATDHDAKGKLPLGATQPIPLLDLLPQQQPGHEPRTLTEANHALEARDAAVVLHDLADDAVDAVHLVPRRGFDVALARDEPPVDPAVEGRARREDGQHAEPGRALDGRLRKHEPELLRQVPDQPPRLDLEHGRVRAPAVQHQDPREQLARVVVCRLAEIRGRRRS